jgi:predicted nucleic acid-binding protein
MSGDFVDSNVVLYMFDRDDAAKRAIARRIVREGITSGSLSISFQVVQEVLNVLTRKLQVPLSAEQAGHLLRTVLSELWHVMPSPEIYQRAMSLAERHGFRFYDAVIVAAALEAGCTRLLSEDLQDGQRIEGLRIENPFTSNWSG